MVGKQAKVVNSARQSWVEDTHGVISELDIEMHRSLPRENMRPLCKVTGCRKAELNKKALHYDFHFAGKLSILFLHNLHLGSRYTQNVNIKSKNFMKEGWQDLEER